MKTSWISKRIPTKVRIALTSGVVALLVLIPLASASNVSSVTTSSINASFTGLKCGTAYTLSATGGGATQTLPPVSTGACAVTRPRVTSESLAPGSTVSGTVTWTVAASGDLRSVEYWRDGIKLATVAGPSPTSYSLDTTNPLLSGSHAFGLVLVDSAGTRWTDYPDWNTTVSNTTQPPPPPPPPPPPADGTVLKHLDYEANTATGLGPSFGWQCHDTVADTSSILRGTLTKDTTTANAGTGSGKFADPAAPSGGRSACMVLTEHSAKTGNDIYYSMAVRFPIGWGGHPNFDSGRVQLSQVEYIAIFGPLGVDAYNDRVVLNLCTGVQKYGVGCDYSNEAGGELGPTHGIVVPCTPVNGPNPFGGEGGCKIIPNGSMTLGVWHQIIIHVRETPHADGLVEAWWRPKGGTWTKTITMSGMPTLALGVDDFGHTWTASDYDTGTGVNGTPGLTDHFGVQAFSGSPATTVNHDDDCIATTFAAAESCFS